MSEPAARLFLATPPGIGAGLAVSCLKAARAAGGVACLLVRADGDGGHDETLAKALIEAGQESGVAVVIEDDAALASRLGADGVHVTSGARDAGAARKMLGEEAIIGGECRGKRHEAMDLGLAGIDYLALDQRLEAGGENMLDWWVEMFVIPVVALHPAAPGAARDLARRGADFILPGVAMWESPEKAAHIIAETMTAIGEGETS